MYIPFTKKEIAKFVEKSAVYIAVDVTNKNMKKFIIKLNGPGADANLATFNMLSTTSMVGLANLQLADEKKEISSKYKHLYLTLSLKCILEWARKKEVKRLAMYTRSSMMPEIFLDAGVNIRKSDALSKEIIYRGSIELKY